MKIIRRQSGVCKQIVHLFSITRRKTSITFVYIFLISSCRKLIFRLERSMVGSEALILMLYPRKRTNNKHQINRFPYEFIYLDSLQLILEQYLERLELIFLFYHDYPHFNSVNLHGKEVARNLCSIYFIIFIFLTDIYRERLHFTYPYSNCHPIWEVVRHHGIASNRSISYLLRI